MYSVGVSFLLLSAFLFLLYFVLPYEKSRRMIIRQYRGNIREFDKRFEKAADKVKERIAEVTPDLLAKEQQSFTFARPATACAFIGSLLVFLSTI